MGCASVSGSGFRVSGQKGQLDWMLIKSQTRGCYRAKFSLNFFSRTFVMKPAPEKRSNKRSVRASDVVPLCHCATRRPK